MRAQHPISKETTVKGGHEVHEGGFSPIPFPSMGEGQDRGVLP